MKLLHIDTGQLHIFNFPPPVPYAILSHTWSSPADDEWTKYDNNDNTNALIRTAKSAIHVIIERFCHIARTQNYEYVWIDAACIDKASSADVSENINSLPGYLRRAGVCITFLADLPCGPSLPWKDTWAHCQFWNRAWTLQELLLPVRVQFYDAQWHLRGERATAPLPALISVTTGIDQDILTQQRSLCETAVGHRMTWASRRKGTRSEDVAYSLLGVFDVRMPAVYGEGARRSFLRLQEEILKYSNDASLFAWTSHGNESSRGIFAESPVEFDNFSESPAARVPSVFRGFAALTSNGVLVEGQVTKHGESVFLDLGLQLHDDDTGEHRGILLRKKADDIYERIMPNTLPGLPTEGKSTTMRMIISGSRFEATKSTDTLFDPDSYSTEEQFHVVSSPQDTSLLTVNRSPTSKSEAESTCISASTAIPPSPRINAAEEPTWVEVSKVYEYDDGSFSDDDYGSLEASKQTQLGDDWDSSVSVASVDSQPTTVANSPAQVETRLDVHQCDFFDKFGSGVPKKEMLDNIRIPGDFLEARLAQVMLRRFPIFLETENHVIEKRLRRIKRSNEQGRPSIGIHSRAALQEFACPFFAKNPDRYVNCLKHHELRSMDDVRRHILQDHRLPFYCPTCKNAFGLASARNQHIIGRTCEFLDEFPFDGISEDHRKSIANTRYIPTEESQWHQTWRILFPHLETPASHLRGGPGLKVSKFRAFWHRHGQAVLEKALSQSMSTEATSEWQDAQLLSSRVLSEVITALVQDL